MQSRLPPPIHPSRRDLGAIGRALHVPRLSLTKNAKEADTLASHTTKNPRVSVPADVNEDFYTEDSLGRPLDMGTGTQSRAAPFPAPLHHGFEQPSQQYLTVDRARPPRPAGPPPFKSASDSHGSTTDTSSSVLAPTTRLLTTVPARSSSTLLNPFADAQPSPAVSDASTAGIAGVGAGNKSPVNPFVTPFDDEHQVTILPAESRKSMKTNPFQPVVM
ncbi:hypothetical protein HDZ31DRAFT_32815 [Schizophyllum fasciatum]